MNPTAKNTLYIAIALIVIFMAGCGVDRTDSGVSIFDGESLDGWQVLPADRSGDWFVRDGVIVGQNNGKGSDIVFETEEFSDFELTLSYRFLTDGNSGIHIRGETGVSEKYEVQGYHADLGHVGIGKGVLGAWDFHGKPRGNDLVKRGKTVVIDARGGKTFTDLENAVTPEDIRRRGWNDVRVVVKGNRLYFTINGKMASEVIDNEPSKRIDKGKIGLQLHSGKPMTIEFKNIKIKRLK